MWLLAQARLLTVAATIVPLTLLVSSNGSAQAGERPNIIWILTDNHGPWTLGCYGNKDIRTPHIDRVAAEGIRFTDAYACNAVCSPTRASYLTGRMPAQHGVHRYLRAGNLQVGPNARSTIAAMPTLSQILADNGYRCGMVGKWHLGDNATPQCGFDAYWITMPHGGTTTFYDAPVLEDGQTRREPEYLTDFWTRHAEKFIRENQQQPFFLMLSYNGPYGLGRSLTQPARNRHADSYRETAFESFPREAVFPWQRANRQFVNHQPAMARYAAEISGIDDGVGRIMATLDQLGLDDNTLVIFTADQGLAGGQHGLWGMGDHTRPIHAFDGTMHIPLLVRQPGQIAAGVTSNALVSNYDFLPSVLGYLELSEQVPQGLPGRDYSPILRGESHEWDNRVFYEFETTRAMRTRDWKLVRRFGEGFNELYDLQNDPQERTNRYGDPALVEIQQSLNDQLAQHFQVYRDPQYDLWTGGQSQTHTGGYGWGTVGQTPVHAPDVFDPAYSGTELQLTRDDLLVEVAAAPPLVEHPTMIDMDDAGRLFVAESSGRNLRSEDLLAEQPGRILMLEDLNDDGLFDKSTVFADSLTLPQGMLCYRDWIYVCSPPSLIRFRDTDGDGRADERKVLVDGFGFTGNAAGVHGPQLSPGGRLYICQGRKPHELKDATGEVVHVGAAARIWSCRLDGSDLRSHAGGGMDNPVEVDFTEEGQVLGTVNLLGIGPRDDALVHWVEDGVYPRADMGQYLNEFDRTGPLLSSSVSFGHIAVSGLTRYRGGALGPSLDDSWLVTEFNRGSLLNVRLEPSGSSYAGSYEPLLTSRSEHFHPTDVMRDDRGDLLLVDTGGWFRIACPSSRYARPELRGAIYRIRPTGAVRPRTVPGGKAGQAKSTEQLFSQLGSADPALREYAMDHLALRGDDALVPLRSVWSDLDERAQQAAVWGVARMSTQEGTHWLRGLAADRDLPRSVRLAALVALCDAIDREAWDVAVGCVIEKDPAIARQAAALLRLLASRAPDERDAAEAFHVVWRRLGEAAGDEKLQHQLISVLRELEATEAIAAGLLADSPPQHARAAFIVARAVGQPIDVERALSWALSADAATREVSLDYLRSDAADVRLIATWVAERLSNARGVAESRGGAAEGTDEAAVLRKTLTTLVSRHLDHTAMQEVVGRELAEGSTDHVMLMLHAIAQGPRIGLPQQWAAPLFALIDAPSEPTRLAALAAIERLDSDAFHARLEAIGNDPADPLPVRIAAWQALARGNSPLPDAGFRLLLDQLEPTAASADRLAAASILARARLSVDQLRALAMQKLARLHPLDLPVVVEAFGNTRNEAVGLALLEGLAEPSVTQFITLEQFDSVLRRYGENVQREADAVREQIKSSDEERRERLGRLIQRLPKGDEQRGAAVFTSSQAACSQCHTIDGQGGKVGPDLSSIGRIRTHGDLVESIVMPAATIARDFETFQVLTADGRILSGLVQRNADGSLAVTGADAKTVTLAAEEIDRIQPAEVSVMPTGLESQLDDQQLADLVSYLLSRNSAAP